MNKTSFTDDKLSMFCDFYGKTIVFLLHIVNSSLNSDSDMKNNYDMESFELQSLNFFGFNLPKPYKLAILESGVNLNQIFNKEFWRNLLTHDINNIKNNRDILFNRLIKRSKHSGEEWFKNQMGIINFCYVSYINQRKTEAIKESNKYTIHNDTKYCGYCGTANEQDTQTNMNSLGRCSDCNVIYYCNQTCQRKDYKIHFKFCQKIKTWIDCIMELKTDY